MDERFDFLSGRLIWVKVFKTDNPVENFGFYNCVSFFETHVFGVISQFNRIKENVPVLSDEGVLRKVNTNQRQLDIYYYILTWDKIKKILKKIEQFMNKIIKERDDIKTEIRSEHRLWRKRMEHLLKEFDDDVRNTYEHPKFEPMVCGNIIMWGSTIIDGKGNIKKHVEGDIHTEVLKRHVERLDSLRIDFIDLILKYFSEKRSSKELLEIRNQIEDNIDEYVEEYKTLRQEGKESLHIFHGLMTMNINLSREGISLSDEVITKIHSLLWSPEID
jgi:hypothetical protein